MLVYITLLLERDIEKAEIPEEKEVMERAIKDVDKIRKKNKV